MRILPKRSHVLASLLVGTWAVLGYACTVEDENPAPNRARPTTDTDGGGSEGGVNPNNTNPTGTLCGKVGGYDKVKVTVIVRSKPKKGYKDTWKPNTWRKSWILK